jgi:anti-anti-sigma factor
MNTATRPKPSNGTRPSVAKPQTEDLLKCLVDSVQDYAIILLDPGGHVMSWNPAAARLHGFREDEIIGEDFSRFYAPDDVRRGKPGKELATATAEGRCEDEGWRMRKDGSQFWANVVITALHDAEGTLRGFGKVARDLTERKESEEKIKRQAQSILEMATVPVVRVWDGIVLVPLIGTLDSQRTQQLMERLLQEVSDSGSRVAIVDITGVPTIDSQTAQHLIDTVSAVRLLGADVVLTGVRPSIAQTLVHLGIRLTDVTTRASLSAGLRTAMEAINLRVAPLQQAA